MVKLLNHSEDEDLGQGSIYGARWKGQTFVIGDETNGQLNEDINIYSVKIKMYRYNQPGTITVSIRETSGYAPVGSDLCVATLNGNLFTIDETGEFYEFVFDINPVLKKGVKYAIIIRALNGSAAQYVYHKWDTYNGTGTGLLSTNSGSSWSQYPANDINFEVWGSRANVPKRWLKFPKKRRIYR